ncbi:MAG: beta-N-acetylhexosaminidase [Fimbriimonadaceae bacterium]|nr:beta-N-acetylhexosaminidase [Fimbriimonadaceae bacterium]
MTALIAAALVSQIAIIPRPVSIEPGVGKFVLNSSTRIVVETETRSLGDQLRGYLAKPTGLQLTCRMIGVDRIPESNTIRLRIDGSLKGLATEGYRLSVTPERVEILAPRAAGVFYGIQSLRQLLPTQAFGAYGVPKEWAIPAVEIEDMPRFGWRGLMLDTCRHFLPKKEILKFIDLLAMHKMNSLHLHLTEDQGWRIEIKKYPKLTEVGAWRKETMLGHYRDGKFDGKPHGGFYTQDDLREIVAYAKKNYINVVPEIEMPGHAQAAIAAYPELGNTGKKLDVGTTWGVIPNITNAEESTVKFMQDVLTEVLDIFPSKFIHIGGDEAPKDQWKASPRAQQLIKERGLKDEHELQSWFIRQMDTWLTARGRRLIGWDEILEGGLAPGATVMSWRGVDGGIAAAQAGHDVVMAPTSHTYLDFYQSKDQSKEPLAIGGFLPLEKVYSYDPIPAELQGPQAKHVLGAQGQLWAEYIPHADHLEYMAFPRACALSEVVWSPTVGKDYDEFLARLNVHLERLTGQEVNFRPLDAPKRGVSATWSPPIPSTFTVKEWDVTEAVKQGGDYEIVFQYTSGGCRLDVEWAELVVNGKAGTRDKHLGITGNFNKDNAFRSRLADFAAGAKVILRASVRADAGTDSSGEISIRRT